METLLPLALDYLLVHKNGQGHSWLDLNSLRSFEIALLPLEKQQKRFILLLAASDFGHVALIDTEIAEIEFFGFSMMHCSDSLVNWIIKRRIVVRVIKFVTFDIYKKGGPHHATLSTVVNKYSYMIRNTFVELEKLIGCNLVVKLIFDCGPLSLCSRYALMALQNAASANGNNGNSLTMLQINGDAVVGEDLYITVCRSCPRLTYLDLSWQYIADHEFEQAPKLERLKYLNLSYCKKMTASPMFLGLSSCYKKSNLAILDLTSDRESMYWSCKVTLGYFMRCISSLEDVRVTVVVNLSDSKRVVNVSYSAM